MNLFLLLTALLGALTGTGRAADLRAPMVVARGIDVAAGAPMKDAVARAISLVAAAPRVARPEGYVAIAPRALVRIDDLSTFAALSAPERRRE